MEAWVTPSNDGRDPSIQKVRSGLSVGGWGLGLSVEGDARFASRRIENFVMGVRQGRNLGSWQRVGMSTELMLSATWPSASSGAEIAAAVKRGGRVPVGLAGGSSPSHMNAWSLGLLGEPRVQKRSSGT